MKTTLAVFLLLTFAVLAAVPPDMEKPIQEGKSAEALARLDTLLKAKPDDAELKKLRTDLSAKVLKTPVTTVTAAEKFVGKKGRDFKLALGKVVEMELVLGGGGVLGGKIRSDAGRIRGGDRKQPG